MKPALLFDGPSGSAYRVILVDANGAPYSAGGGGGGGSGVDREIVITTYRARTAGTGYAVGDAITATRILDVSGSSALQVGTTVWYNETTPAAIATAPNVAHLTLAGAGALTDAELRAAAVRVVPATGTLTDRSGTITSGGTAQQLMAANAARMGFAVQNLSAGDLWIRTDGSAAVASQPSLKLSAGDYYETPAGGQPVGVVSIFGATTAQAFTAREW
jgi:hypothetical protein